MGKAFKVILYIIGGILLLLLCAVLYINSPWGQNFVRARVESYLHSKLKTVVHIGHLGYGIPKYVVINDALFLDQHSDTLLSVNTLKVDLNMLQLLHKKAIVQQLVLKGVHSHIYRNVPDTTFNFSYIINAFSGNSPHDTAHASQSSSLSFDIDKIKLDDIHARYDDYTGGLQFAFNLDHLDLRMKKLDMDNMLFHISNLDVGGLQTTFEQDTSFLPPTPKDTSKSLVKVIADNVNLNNIAFRYNNNLNKFLFALQLGSLQLQLNRYDRDSNLVDVKRLAISNSSAQLTIGKSTTPPSPVDTIVKIDTTEGWDVKARDVDLSGLDFKMDNDNEPKLANAFDYWHLDLRGFAMKLSDLAYADTVSANIQHMAVTDKSGLDVRELKTRFYYSDKGFALKDLYLQTPNTLLHNYFEMHYPSIPDMEKHPGNIQLKTNIQKSIVGIQDLLLFVPDLRKEEMFRKYERGHISLEANATGQLNDLHIAHFYTRCFDNTELLVNNSRLGGMPDVNRITYNLHIGRFTSSRNDMNALLPPNTIPASIRLPDRFGATGLLAGNERDVTADLAMVSTDGEAYVKGMVATSPGKGREKYDLVVRTKQLDIGHIIKDSLVGSVTADINVKGKSFDTKTMNAAANGTISSAFIKGYRYHNISLDANIADQHATGKLSSVDPNVQLQANAAVNFSGKYAAVLADVNIDSIDFEALKFSTSELRARGRIHADFPELNPDYPKGRLVWYQPVILADNKRYFSDSMYVVSRPSADSGQNIFVNIGVLDAHLTGHTPFTRIGAEVQEHINRHYNTALVDTLRTHIAKHSKKHAEPGARPVKQIVKDTTVPADYNLYLVAHVYDRPLLHSILPGLTSFDSIHVDARIDPATLTLNANAPEIIYGSYTIENSRIALRENDSALKYALNVDKATVSNYGVYFASVQGAIDKNIVTTAVSLSDAAKKERFALNAQMQVFADSQLIQLQPGLKLNYDPWEVKQPNRIVFNNAGFYVQNFGISNKDQYISANNEQTRANTPFKLVVNNFQLANLTDITSINDTLVVNGVLSGDVLIDQFKPVTKMTGNLQVQNLSLFGDTVGNLQAIANNKTDDQIDTKITLTGYGSDLQLTGFYDLKANSSSTLNFDININALAARAFEGTTMHQLKNSSGYLRGHLKLTGTMSSPNITGDLRTDQFKTTVATLNTEFSMPSDNITFSGDKAAFSNFTILDSAGNKASVNGTIGFSDLTDPDFDLSVVANNWTAIHSTAKQNKDLYGDLVLSTKLKVAGTASAPAIDGNMFILKGTKLTVANPENDPELQSTKGIVVFVNMRDSTWGKVLMPRRQDTTRPRHKLAAGSDINVNITVNKDAEFSLIIDEASGDFVRVSGDAYLNTSVTADGTYLITGNYLLHGGLYQMNYNFIRRQFKINDGSTITFSGDPLKNTNLDVSATYLANTPPYDLIMRQVADPAQLNYYKQSLPFNVDLNMKGNLMSPAFTFNVVLPEDKVYPLAPDQIELVQARLSQLRQDTADLNKQVFAVLILGRFVADDPFNSNAGQTVGSAAMQSVSSFIGQQLNNAAHNLVKGVDLSVDLATTDDYTTGQLRQRSDLNVAASKRILNDRLKITVGNDFEVEGPQTNNNNQNSVVPSNLAADYLLSSDGRYTVRAYRQNYDEGALEGFVTETGVNFIVSVDYNRFKTIFWKSKRRSPNKNELLK